MSDITNIRDSFKVPLSFEEVGNYISKENGSLKRLINEVENIYQTASLSEKQQIIRNLETAVDLRIDKFEEEIDSTFTSFENKHAFLRWIYKLLGIDPEKRSEKFEIHVREKWNQWKELNIVKPTPRIYLDETDSDSEEDYDDAYGIEVHYSRPTSDDEGDDWANMRSSRSHRRPLSTDFAPLPEDPEEL